MARHPAGAAAGAGVSGCGRDWRGKADGDASAALVGILRTDQAAVLFNDFLTIANPVPCPWVWW